MLGVIHRDLVLAFQIEMIRLDAFVIDSFLDLRNIAYVWVCIPVIEQTVCIIMKYVLYLH